MYGHTEKAAPRRKSRAMRQAVTRPLSSINRRPLSRSSNMGPRVTRSISRSTAPPRTNMRPRVIRCPRTTMGFLALATLRYSRKTAVRSKCLRRFRRVTPLSAVTLLKPRGTRKRRSRDLPNVTSQRAGTATGHLACRLRWLSRFSVRLALGAKLAKPSCACGWSKFRGSKTRSPDFEQ